MQTGVDNVGGKVMNRRESSRTPADESASHLCTGAGGRTECSGIRCITILESLIMFM